MTVFGSSIFLALGLVRPAEHRKLAQQLRGAKLREKVLREAGKQFNQKPNSPDASDIAAFAVYSSTPASVSLLLIGGLLAWEAGRWRGRQTDRVKSLAIWKHAIIRLAAYGVVFAVAGMAPAGDDPGKCSTVDCNRQRGWRPDVVGFLLWRARFRFTLQAAFIIVFVACEASAG